ncbi:MAG TPA: hypothetical protein VHV79_13485 [Mycobacteriales bacterium]|nr:hypothetical protein [Mycobacteriales bacterium]
MRTEHELNLPAAAAVEDPTSGGNGLPDVEVEVVGALADGVPLVDGDDDELQAVSPIAAEIVNPSPRAAERARMNTS